MTFVETNVDRAKTGIWGLDDILSGGFTRQHVFLLEGEPGTGKTTIALQFLMEGARAGEKGLQRRMNAATRAGRPGDGQGPRPAANAKQARRAKIRAQTIIGVLAVPSLWLAVILATAGLGSTSWG